MAHVNPVQVQKYLKGVDYPASKATLIEKAKSMGADENVCASLEQLPDEEFQTPADVSQAFGALPDDAGAGRGQASGGGEDKQARGREAKGGRGREEKAARGEPAARPREGEAGRGAPGRYTGSNEFLIEAMQDAMAEIQICELALEKSARPDVKAFAQSMIDEHGRMGRELEQLAGQKRLDVPREIRPEQEMTVDELSSLDGRDFEQRWIQYNIDVHERDIKVFRHYAEDEPDPDVRELAGRNGEVLARHLKMAHEVGKKLARA